MSKDLGTIWVCQDCVLHHVDGECDSCHYYGHDRSPLSLIRSDEKVTWDDSEVNNYSTSQCEGCGSRLHGERHAMTLWSK